MYISIWMRVYLDNTPQICEYIFGFAIIELSLKLYNIIEAIYKSSNSYRSFPTLNVVKLWNFCQYHGYEMETHSFYLILPNYQWDLVPFLYLLAFQVPSLWIACS